MEVACAYFASLKYAHIKFLSCWSKKKRETPCVSCPVSDTNQRAAKKKRETPCVSCAISDINQRAATELRGGSFPYSRFITFIFPSSHNGIDGNQ